MLSLKEIKKNYDGAEVLKNISIEFPSKGFYAIIGESGSGKTTLLNIIGTLEKPDYGNVFFNSINLCKISEKEKAAYRAKNVGFVFQEYNLIEEESVLNNIKIAINEEEHNEKELDKILNKLGINDLKYRIVNTLSGGERQRVAIARALYKGVSILLVDEPTANLDKNNTESIMNILKLLSNDILVICISHEHDLIKQFTDKIITLKNGTVFYKKNKEKLLSTSKKEIDLKYSGLNLTFKQQIAYFLNTFLKKKKNILRYITITLFGMLFMGLTLTFSQINPYKILSSSINSEGLPTIRIAKIEDQNEPFYYTRGLLSDELNYLNNKGFDVYPYIRLSSSTTDDEFICPSEQISLVFGGEFNNTDLLYGDPPKEDFDIVITDYLAELFLQKDLFSNVNSIKDLINKEYKIYILSEKFNFKISGIISTKAKDYKNSKYQTVKNLFCDNKNHFYFNIYTTKDTFTKVKENVKYSEMIIYEDKNSKWKTIFSYHPDYNQYIITKDKGELGRDEVYLFVSYIWYLTGYSYEYIINNPEQILQEFNYEFNYTYENWHKKFVIKGIIDDTDILKDYHYRTIVVNSERIFDFHDQHGLIGGGFTINNLDKLNTYYYNFFTEISIYETMIKATDIISLISTILFFIFLIFFFAIIITYNLIRLEELSRFIAILTSLGYYKNKLFKLIYKENIIIIFVTSLLYLILALLVNIFVNKIILFNGLISISTRPYTTISIVLVILFYITSSLIINKLLIWKKTNKDPVIILFKES